MKIRFQNSYYKRKKNKHKLYNNLEYKTNRRLEAQIFIYHRWYYFAVLSLAGLEHNLADLEWIAKG